MNGHTLTHGGLFEGIGGFSLGARLTGIQTLWACEFNNYKQNILSQHFPNTKLYGKIENIQNAPYVDIITGGFPCQDVSSAGLQLGIAGGRSSLWQEMYRVCADTNPKYIIIENSANLLNAGLEYVLYDLAQIGYNAEWQVISATQFGYRHLRKRLFVVAYTNQIRRITKSTRFFRGIKEIFPATENTERNDLSMLLERFDEHTDTSRLRNNAGFSHGLDKNRLEAIGDSVNVAITQYLFECIKIHYKKHFIK